MQIKQALSSIGLFGLIQSKKGTLSLIILAASTTAVMLSKIDGMSYAAIMGTIGTIYCWTAHKTDLQAMQNQNAAVGSLQVINQLPPRGQL